MVKLVGHSPFPFLMFLCYLLQLYIFFLSFFTMSTFLFHFCFLGIRTGEVFCFYDDNTPIIFKNQYITKIYSRKTFSIHNPVLNISLSYQILWYAIKTFSINGKIRRRETYIWSVITDEISKICSSSQKHLPPLKNIFLLPKKHFPTHKNSSSSQKHLLPRKHIFLLS